MSTLADNQSAALATYLNVSLVAKPHLWLCEACNKPVRENADAGQITVRYGNVTYPVAAEYDETCPHCNHVHAGRTPLRIETSAKLYSLHSEISIQAISKPRSLKLIGFDWPALEDA